MKGGVRTHWLIRTVAIVLGLAFLLLGGLALVVSVNMWVQGVNGAGGRPVSAAVHAIMVRIMGCITLFGGFLIWLGVKRPKRSFEPMQTETRAETVAKQEARLPTAPPQRPEVRPYVAQRESQPSRQTEFTDAVTIPVQPGRDADAPPLVPEFGPFIAMCGPRQAGQTHYIVMGAGMLVLAVVCLIAPSTFLLAKPGDEAMIQNVSWIGAGVSVLFGLGMILGPLFGQNQTIFLYERGIIERRGAKCHPIPLDSIELLRVQEWFEHRFAPRTFNVRAKVRGRKELSFSSALYGESERIIAYLVERVDETEMVPFEA